MSFIWEKSPRWRRLVLATRESPPLMLAFTCVCFALPAALGLLTMGATNPAEDAAREALLRQRAGLDGTMLARANKERLGVLLSEVKERRGGEERYKQALQGRTLGTSSGTSSGVRRGIDGA